MLARWSVFAFLISTAVVTVSAQRQPGTFTYSHTTQQTLADGTHITRITHTVMIRDAYGRTRNENEVQMPGRSTNMRTVNIVDPVAGVTYFYQENEGQNVPHTYTRFEMHKPAQNLGLRTLPAVPSSSGIVTGAGALGAGVVTAIAGGSVGGAVPVSQPGGSTEMRPEIKNEDLGFDTVQGVSCKSRRTTETYPVNFFGNDRPIVVTRESCMSVESGGMLVRNVNDDPRMGTQTMLLESASFADPATSLFQPPPGYTERKQNQPQ